MKKDNENNRTGISFVGALQLIFITLKLIGKIDWAWWKVLLPLEIHLGIGVVLVVLIVLAKMTSWFIKNMEKKVK